MRYRLMASYLGASYQAAVGPSDRDVTLFAAPPPPEEHGFSPAPGGIWRKQVRLDDLGGLWESRPIGSYHGEPCLVLDDLGDRLHIVYLGMDERRAAQLGYWEVDRGVFEVVVPRLDVSDLAEERHEFPIALLLSALPALPRALGAGNAGGPAGPGSGQNGAGPAMGERAETRCQQGLAGRSGRSGPAVPYRSPRGPGRAWADRDQLGHRAGTASRGLRRLPVASSRRAGRRSFPPRCSSSLPRSASSSRSPARTRLKSRGAAWGCLLLRVCPLLPAGLTGSACLGHLSGPTCRRLPAGTRDRPGRRSPRSRRGRPERSRRRPSRQGCGHQYRSRP